MNTSQYDSAKRKDIKRIQRHPEYVRRRKLFIMDRQLLELALANRNATIEKLTKDLATSEDVLSVALKTNTELKTGKK